MVKKIPLKRLLLLFLFCTYNQIVIAQTVAPNIKSPNVASMERFGDIPVSLFTGVPDISIPLYTLNSGNISIPISLKYHPSSVKPAQHPSWVGLGWDLQSTGSISRKVNNIPDEDNYIRMIEARFRPFYPTSNTALNNNECGGTFVQNSTWTELINKYYSQYNNPTVLPELNADEFSFNFLGHSGVFYYGGPAAGWIVTSDENITVEVNSFLDPNNLAAIANYYSRPFPANQYNSTDKSRSFGEFTLTTEDGTKYTFGGADAVELHTDYFFTATGGSIAVDSWLLKKIVDSNGHEVIYTYAARDYRTCNLNYYYSNSFTSDSTIRPGDPTFDEMETSSFSCSNWSLIDTRQVGGQILFPVYLSKISSENETVEFANSIVNSLRYTNTEFNTNAPNLSLGPQKILIGDDGQYLKWKKLTSIRVKNIANTTIMGYDFNYNENSSQRFSLASLDVLPFPASSGLPKKVYEFKYNDIAGLPPYNGNYTDHWGFYNGKNIHGTEFTYSAKDTDPLYLTKGLLSELKYPTGGYSEFLWEAHQHSKKVTKKRDNLETYPGYAGGCRISEIKGFSQVGNLVSSKKYYYVNGYTSTVNVNSLTSSGVLNGKPLYVFQLANRTFAPSGNPESTTTLNHSMLSINSSANYGFAGNGSHIGYDQVVEKNMDNSYTKHYFTNYGIDINGEKHFDRIPEFIVGWKAGDDSYIPYSSLELERGKEIGTFSYNTNNQLVKKNVVTYRYDAERFNQYTKQLNYTPVPFCAAAAAASQFVAGVNMFNYRYYPVKNETTTYDVNGNNGVTESKQFTYNFKNQLASELSVTSIANKKLTTKYFYPDDIISESNYGTLVYKNIINKPIKTQTFVNEEKTSEQRTTYDIYGLPSVYYQAYFPNTLPTVSLYNTIGNLEKKAEYKYDKGNPVEILKTDGIPVSYIWGYNKTQVIAKIENGTSGDVFPYITNLQTLSNSTAAGAEASLILALNALRSNLPNAMITTYTYIPLVGVSTITDPKGDKITFTYDAFGRLEFVKDKSGNILSDNQYNYKQ